MTGKTKHNKTGRIFLIIVFLLIFGLLIKYFAYLHNIRTPVDKNSSIVKVIQIAKGQTAREIGKNLKKNNLIRSSDAFYFYTKINDLGEKISAGSFRLNQSMNVPAILQIITNPTQSKSTITIQEGLNIRQIDQKLADLQLIKTGDFIFAVKKFTNWNLYPFLKKEEQTNLEFPLEGYLYPDTYFLDPSTFQPNDLIFKALNNFENKTADLLPQIKRHSIQEIITMASIIENEIFGEKDRKIVSGILWKRLENNWALGADATILYVTTDRKITADDLTLDSQYNSRKNLGLPPGPISNPSVESILAAMFPEESSYWFYLTTLDTGAVIYAKTNEEHNANKAKYL